MYERHFLVFMSVSMSTYLLINLLTISFPLVRSFESRIQFAKQWKGLLWGISIPGAIFIVWDIWFTEMGVWGFNPKHLTGIEAFGLPIEEWLFFLTVPYACLFTYEVLNYFVKKDILGNIARPFAWGLSATLMALGLFFMPRWYTSLTFISAGIYVAFQAYQNPSYLGRFFLAYLVSLIPFLIVNGVLTGSFIEEEVVWYNNAENLGLRIGTIPVEDTIYALLLLMMNTSIYEYFKQSQISPETTHG